MPITERKLSTLELIVEAQPRERIDLDVVGDYSEVLEAGGKLPPIIVFGNIVADGFHRHLAHQNAQRKTISVIVHPGGRREAILYSCGANAIHGLRRSNADKRRAVLKLLGDTEWRKWADRRIAKTAAVSQPFVSDLRASDNDFQMASRLVERDGTEYEQKVSLRPTPIERSDPSEKAILAAVGLLARSDAGKFDQALDEPQRERLLGDLPKARAFLDSL